MGTESLKRIGGLDPSMERDRHDDLDAATDVWAVPTRERRGNVHINHVVGEARSLLGALGANVDWLRSVLPAQVPAGDLAGGLSDIAVCCERLHDLLQDALIGARKEGLSANRTLMSVEATLEGCIRQIRRRAAARSMTFELLGGEVYTMLDGPLFARAVVRLLDQIVRHTERNARIQVRYTLEKGEFCVMFAKVEARLRSVAPSGSLRPPSSLERPASIRPLRPSIAAMAMTGSDFQELDFCHLAAEAHGGTLVVGGAVLYRMTLPASTPSRGAEVLTLMLPGSNS